MNPFLIGLAHRANTTAADVVATLNTTRYDAIMNNVGLNTSNVTSSEGPNWGSALWNIAGVYIDPIGMAPFFLIVFALPFIMMWIVHADMVPAGIIGLLLGVYIFGFIGSSYAYLGILFMVISGATIIWSLWQKRG